MKNTIMEDNVLKFNVYRIKRNQRPPNQNINHSQIAFAKILHVMDMTKKNLNAGLKILVKSILKETLTFVVNQLFTLSIAPVSIL